MFQVNLYLRSDMSDLQRYLLNLYLSNKEEDIFVFLGEPCMIQTRTSVFSYTSEQFTQYVVDPARFIQQN